MDEVKLSKEEQYMMEKEVDVVDSKQLIIQHIKDDGKHIQYRVYPIRWLMLLALVVLNISNGMVGGNCTGSPV